MKANLQFDDELFNRVRTIEYVQNFKEIEKNSVLQYLLEYYQLEKSDLNKVLSTIKKCKSQRLATALAKQVGATLPSVLSLSSVDEDSTEPALLQASRHLDTYYWQRLIQIFDLRTVLTEYNINIIQPYIEKYTDQPNIEFSAENVQKLFTEISELYVSGGWNRELHKLHPMLEIKTYKNNNIELILHDEKSDLSKNTAYVIMKYIGNAIIANGEENWVERITKNEIDKPESWDANNMLLSRKSDRIILKMNKDHERTVYHYAGLWL